jgi:hypothetical protein
MSKTREVVASKTTYLDVVQIVFIILKLTDNIDWSWWWVLCPMWGVLAVLLALALIVKILVD